MYTLHGREDDWIKVKPEYMDSLGEEVDVLVMGGFWGSGRRGGTLGSFVCGVMDRTEDGDSRCVPLLSSAVGRFRSLTSCLSLPR